MSRSTHHKEKHGGRSELSEDNCHEGTSARTRPFTYEEIMLRRKKRKQSGDVEALAVEKGDKPETDMVDNVSDRLESERRYRNKNGSVSADAKHSSDDTVRVKHSSDDSVKVKHSSDDIVKVKHSSDDTVKVKHSSGDTVKVNSRVREHDLSLTEDNLVKSKEKESHHYQTKSKVTLDKDGGDRAKEGKDDRQVHGKRKTEERFSGDYENESGKRHARDLERKERYADVSRGRSGKASKTKDIDEDDEISKFKNQDDDRSRLKSQDDMRSRLKSQGDVGSRLKSQDDVGSRLRSQDDERSRLKSQDDVRSRLRSQDDERSRIKSQVDERSRLKSQDDVRSRLKSQDDERSRIKSQDDVRSRLKSQDDERSRLKSQLSERSRLKSQVDERSKLKSQLDEGSRVKRHDDERSGLNNKDNEGIRLKNKADDGSRANQDDDRSRANNQDDERSRTKNHDSGRWHGSSNSERRDKEATQLKYEVSKSKRRRSRSRERGKDRGRRSVSLSPRSSKRTLFHERDHEQLPKYSSKDKSRKLQSDDDRSRISSNGSSSQHRKHDELTDRLGGYSPRKRKTEVSGKTHSPSLKSPEKTSAILDHQPTGLNNNASSSVVPPLHSFKSTISSNAFEPLSMSSVSSSTVRAFSVAFSNTSVDSIQLTQATRPMRRLCLENIPASASEKAVMEWLNNFLLSSGVNRIHGSQPCISCIIQKEKGQALAEFLTPEDASAAMSFDERSFLGSIVKIRRPKDYVEVATTGVADISEAAPDSVSDVVRDTPHKIFIGGISSAILSEMLREITSAFGPLKAFHFEVTVGLNESRAFLEYADHSITAKACAGLNGIRLGGKMLTVVPATPDVPSVDHSDVPPFYGTPENAKPLLEKPTRVLMLKNLFNPEAPALNESELKELLEDVRLECARFGYVKSVNVIKSGECHMMLENSGVLDKPVLSTHSTNIGSDEGNTKTEVCGEIIERNSPDICVPNPPNNTIESKGDGVIKDDSVCGEELIADPKHEGPTVDYEEIRREDSNSKNNDKFTPVELEDQLTSKDHDFGEICKDSNSEKNDNVPRVKLEDQLTPKDHTQDAENNDQAMAVDHEEKLNPEDHLQDGDEDHLQDGNNDNAISVELEDEPNSKDSDKMGDDVSVMTDIEKENLVMVEDDDGKLVQVSSQENGGVKKDLDSDVVTSENIETCDGEKSYEEGCVLVEYTRTEAASSAAHCLHGRLFDNRVVAVQYVPYDAYKLKFPE